MSAETEVLPTGRETRVAGLEVYVESTGAGSQALLLHQHTGPAWTPLHAELSGTNTIIAPHLPGYGRSERPAWARHPRDVAILTGMLVDELELDRPHVVGLGFGGWVAAELATMRPGQLASLTLVGAAGLQPRQGEIYDWTTDGFIEEIRLSFEDGELFDEVFGLDPPKEIIDLWDFSREMTARLSWKPWLFSHELPGTLAGLTTPTLVVHGADDRIFPVDCGRRYAELIPGAKLEIIENAGHMLEMEKPEELVELISRHLQAIRTTT
jgi:pimeloyl-ACP methyl ester carboxylesterase